VRGYSARISGVIKSYEWYLSLLSRKFWTVWKTFLKQSTLSMKLSGRFARGLTFTTVFPYYPFYSVNTVCFQLSFRELRRTLRIEVKPVYVSMRYWMASVNAVFSVYGFMSLKSASNGMEISD